MTETQTTQPTIPAAEAEPKLTFFGNKKLVVVTVLSIILLVFIIAVGAYALFGNRESEIQPTPVPTATTMPPTPTTVQVTSSPEISTTPTAPPSAQRYVLPDCEIEMTVSDMWIPSERGTLGTCGLFRTGANNRLGDFNSYDGVVLAIVRFPSDSELSVNLKIDSSKYLAGLPVDPKRFDAHKDFLYSRKDTTIAGKPAISAEIYKAGVGDTSQIFFKGALGEYVIIWGGKDAGLLQTEVTTILSTVEFLQTQNP